MKRIIVLVLVAGSLWSCNQQAPESVQPSEAAVTQEAAPQPTEFADESYTDLCKQALTSMTIKDIDGLVSNIADDAIWVFNSGDSISGKQAIADYWTNRLTNAIDKLEISNEIWLSLKVNESTQGVRTGNWVLGWADVTASYIATGKSMSQNIHMLYHFDDDGKFDRVIQYLDRASIIAASTKE